MLQDVPKDFTLKNYVYPLDISDPAFVSLADVQGYPAIGFKQMGTGKVVYLGLEYYYDETISSRILENTLRWLSPVSAPAPQISPVPAASQAAGTPESWPTRTAVRRSEEVLYTGSTPAAPKSAAVDLKLYPNPYVDKATLDIDLPRLSVVSVDLTDESGVLVASPFKRQIVSAGPLRIDIPPVEAGVYFLKCQIDGKNYVRKLVKVESR